MSAGMIGVGGVAASVLKQFRLRMARQFGEGPTPAVQMLLLDADPKALARLYVDLINAVVAGRPKGMTIGLHLCRGNYKGQWMAAGGYAPVADELFGRAAVDAFFLEYDSERAGDFGPLRFVPKEKAVVLGLVSSKTPALEPVDGLLKRLDAASRHVPMERLAVSPQCGFGTTVGGAPMTEDDEKRKLALVGEVARKAWS